GKHIFRKEKFAKIAACRQVNIDLLISLRFYIFDLYKQLQYEHGKQFPSSSSASLLSDLKLYRGQLMATDELDSIRKEIELHCSGDYDSLNTSDYVPNDEWFSPVFDHNEKESVLFKIEIPSSSLTATKPFANISHLSHLDENETLLMMRSVFKLMNIYYEEVNNVYVIQLSLVLDAYSEVKAPTLYLQIIETGTWLSVVPTYALLYFLYPVDVNKRFSICETMFNSLINQFALDSSKIIFQATCYIGLGWTFLNKQDYNSALKKIYVLCFNCLGMIYEQKMFDYDKAMEYYTKASELVDDCGIQINKYASHNNFRNIPLVNIAVLYNRQGNAHLAWETYKRLGINSDDYNFKNGVAFEEPYSANC
ncbi:unnamed protein product, partial [Didymodactylos carnosus]